MKPLPYQQLNMQGKHRFCLCIQLLPCFIDRTKLDGRSRASVVIVIRVGFVVNYKCRTIALFAFLSLIHRLSCFTSSVLLAVGPDFLLFNFGLLSFLIDWNLRSKSNVSSTLFCVELLCHEAFYEQIFLTCKFLVFLT